jgi:hypothetical protein
VKLKNFRRGSVSAAAKAGKVTCGTALVHLLSINEVKLESLRFKSSAFPLDETLKLSNIPIKMTAGAMLSN